MEKLQEINGFVIEELSSFPAGENPLKTDLFSMGTSLGNNVMMLHCHFPDQKANGFILVDIPTGQRVRIIPPSSDYKERE
jgi:hypothetical protein